MLGFKNMTFKVNTKVFDLKGKINWVDGCKLVTELKDREFDSFILDKNNLN